VTAGDGLPALEFDCGSCLDPGRARPDNQDSLLVERGRHPGTWVLVVADGVGGLSGGAEASDTAVTCVAQAVRGCEGGLVSCAISGIDAANNEIVSRNEASGVGSGTTIAAAVIEGSRAEIIHAGDSRAYLLRGTELLQLTEDHSLVAEAVRAGQISSEEARTHPRRNAITRALGVEREVRLERRELELRPGDALMLCSDGLHGLVEDDEIHAFLGQDGGAEERARNLVAAANRAGGTDNIAVVVALARAANGNGPTATVRVNSLVPTQTG
jgi:protein phosphatase